jgi:hypothetical protein
LALSPGQLGRRYSPLIILAATMLVLAAVAPSIPGSKNDATNVVGGASGGQVGGEQAAGPDAAGGAAGANGAAGASGGGGAASGARGAGSASAAAAGAGAPGGDRSKCDKNGKQIGISFYMPPCSPVWHGGDNGGATMTGVTGTTINYLFYRQQPNAQVNAVLSQEDLAETDTQFCQAVSSFHDELNKRWEFYGRKLVSMDGPSSGKHNGSSIGGCNFPYFQGQCSLTPPDPPCERAEADLIASMKPAMVVSPVTGTNDALYNQLGKDHIVVIGGETVPDSFHTSIAPYYYDSFMNGDRVMRLEAEYYCKRLYGKPVKWAGQDVETFNGPTAPPPKRKVAITYPATNGDPLFDISAKEFMKLVTGGQCGSPSDGVKAYPYQSDITTAQQQSTTTVAQLKQDHVTTLVFYGDPIAPVFFSEAAAAQNYHPEILISGALLVDYDALGQLYVPSVWQHAFGPSTLMNTIPFSDSEAVAAWHDAGRSGEPDKTANLNWAYYTLLGNALQLAGPKPTPASIRDGLFTAPPAGGDPLHTLQMFGRPDTVSPQGDYTGLHDEREVFWCANQRSPLNGHNGTYVPVDNGRRYQLGQWPVADPAVFPNGPC